MWWTRQLTGLLISIGALLALYWGSVRDLATIWSTSDAYRFLYLIPPISLFIIWSRRAWLARIAPGLRLWAVIPLIAFAGLWLVSRSAFLAVGEHIALVGMLQSLLVLFLGGRVFRALLFPFALMWMMVPLGDGIVPPLMTLTMSLTKAAFGLVGMAVQSDGSILITPAGRYGVVEECSALPFIVGNLIITLVFANLNYRRFHKQALLVIASLPVAMAANVIRIVAVVFITEGTDGRINLIADHITFGWVVFAIAVALELALAARYAERHTPMAALASLEPRFARRQSRRSVVASMVIAIGTMALPVAWMTYGIPNSAATPAACRPGALFEAVATPSDWRPLYGMVPDLQAMGQVAAPLGAADIYIAYYRWQSPGHELVAWDNKPYDGVHWGLHETVPGPGNLAWGMPRPEAVRLRNTIGDRRLVWTWFWVEGRFTGDPLVAKIRQALATLGGHTGSGALILSIAENPDAASAEPRLRAALAAMDDPAALMRRAAETACPAPGAGPPTGEHAKAW